MLHKKFETLFKAGLTLAVILTSNLANAGTEGRGGGDFHGINAHPTYSPDVSEFLEYFESGRAKRDAIQNLKSISQIETSRPIDELEQLQYLIKQGLIQDLEDSPITLEPRCFVDGRETTMSTLKGIPRSPICVSATQIALIVNPPRTEGTSIWNQQNHNWDLMKRFPALLVHEAVRHFGAEDTTETGKHPLASFIYQVASDFAYGTNYLRKHSSPLTDNLIKIRPKDWSTLIPVLHGIAEKASFVEFKFEADPNAPAYCKSFETTIYTSGINPLGVFRRHSPQSVGRIRTDGQTYRIPLNDPRLIYSPFSNGFKSPGIEVRFRFYTSKLGLKLLYPKGTDLTVVTEKQMKACYGTKILIKTDLDENFVEVPKVAQTRWGRNRRGDYLPITAEDEDFSHLSLLTDKNPDPDWVGGGEFFFIKLPPNYKSLMGNGQE